MAAGRPTKYKPEFCELARKTAEIGAIDGEIANIIGVAESTLNLWKEEHPEFSEALKAGKAVADSKVQKSLYHRATGYENQAVKIFQNEGQTFEHAYTERYPPDPTSCIFWLKNRQKDQWRDKIETELTGKDGGPIVAVIRDKD